MDKNYLITFPMNPYKKHLKVIYYNKGCAKIKYDTQFFSNFTYFLTNCNRIENNTILCYRTWGYFFVFGTLEQFKIHFSDFFQLGICK